MRKDTDLMIEREEERQKQKKQGGRQKHNDMNGDMNEQGNRSDAKQANAVYKTTDQLFELSKFRPHPRPRQNQRSSFVRSKPIDPSQSSFTSVSLKQWSFYSHHYNSRTTRSQDLQCRSCPGIWRMTLFIVR